MTKIPVAVLVGSLREGSLNRRMARAMASMAPSKLEFREIAIGALPFYNSDLDGDQAPPAWTSFRDAVTDCQALLFVTPEYNRSVPAPLKNAIDVGSRPRERNVWAGKPGAVVSVSPGAIGGFGAHHHLRQSLVCLDVAVMAAPEAYVGSAGDLFDADGGITDTRRREFMEKFVARFARWIEAIRGSD